MTPTDDLSVPHAEATSSPGNDYEDSIEANVALDLFLDPNPQRANITKLPMYELMIWFNAVPGLAPIGWSKSVSEAHSYDLDNTTL